MGPQKVETVYIDSILSGSRRCTTWIPSQCPTLPLAPLGTPQKSKRYISTPFYRGCGVAFSAPLQSPWTLSRSFPPAFSARSRVLLELVEAVLLWLFSCYLRNLCAFFYKAEKSKLYISTRFYLSRGHTRSQSCFDGDRFQNMTFYSTLTRPQSLSALSVMIVSYCHVIYSYVRASKAAFVHP